MIAPTIELLHETLAQARLAPTVHNVQPTRWRIAGNRLQLLGDVGRKIPIADPEGRDWRLSHGAVLEGLAIALRARGLDIVDIAVVSDPEGPAAELQSGHLVSIAEMSLSSTHDMPDVRPEHIEGRVTWRGRFAPIVTDQLASVETFFKTHPDCLVISKRDAIQSVSDLYDEANIHFLRQPEHRQELLAWMRLSKRHPRFLVDGLSYNAMQMSSLEAFGAKFVLGKAFGFLDAFGIAKPILLESAKTLSASALVVFHRPCGEDPLITGRAFYRAWLAFEGLGFKACPMSVLADWDVSHERLRRDFKIQSDRRIVNVFRLGQLLETPSFSHERLSVGDLIV